MYNQQRRQFLRNVALLAPALAVMPSSLSGKHVRILRTGFIGTGAWGRQYLSAALAQQSLRITALCDTNKSSLHEGLQLFQGYSRPAIYSSYQELLTSKDVDVVIIATPAHTHYTIAKAAMLAGKHVACGPVMGETVAEHLDIVKTSKATGCHYFTLDEQSYRDDLHAISNMVKDQHFGELHTIYAGARYDILPPQEDAYPLYPSLFPHQVLGLGKDNRYVSVQAVTQQVDYMVSKADPKTGKLKTITKKGAIPLICLTTSQGQQVYLQTEKGYSTGTRIHGKDGSWVDFTQAIHLASQAHPYKVWQHDAAYLQEYASADRVSPTAMALHALVSALEVSGKPLPVYIAATNSLINILGQASSRQGGKAVAFPDITLI